ncbi:TIGR03943 family putative permease subunit [Peribacillus sp. NPDC060253]|uniref:TIGR03943 family putative permease subunit n=1 Tax=Peribacillus sp. NPDC060253 TaxID=3347084 RepID=UPI0036497A60
MKNITYKFEALLLLGLGLMIFKLYVSGNLTQLIAPKMLSYSLISLAAFLIVGCLRMKKEKNNVHCCGCVTDQEKSKSSLTSISKYGLFLIPILLGFTLTNFTLSEDVLAKRGIVQKQIQSDDTAKNETFHQHDVIKVDDKNYFQVLDYLMTNIEDIEGRKIEISGFVYRENQFPKNQIAIARLSMTCCIVDANLYGYQVNGHVKKMKTNSWYTIQGKLTKGSYNGETVPVIQLITSKKIQAPKDVYLYEYVDITE